MNTPMNEEDMEKAYDILARAIDAVGEEHASLFLGKLALTLAYQLGDLEPVKEAIAIALQDIE